MAYQKFLCSHMFPDGIRYMVTHVTCPLYSNHCQGRSRDPIFVTQFDYLKQPVRFNRFHRPFWTFQNIIVSLFHSFFFLQKQHSHVELPKGLYDEHMGQMQAQDSTSCFSYFYSSMAWLSYSKDSDALTYHQNMQLYDAVLITASNVKYGGFVRYPGTLFELFVLETKL